MKNILVKFIVPFCLYLAFSFMLKCIGQYNLWSYIIGIIHFGIYMIISEILD